MRHQSLIFRTILLLIALLSPASPAQDAPAIPDTPAGEELRWVLDWLASDFGDDTLSRFHDRFLQDVPPMRLRAAHAQIGALFRPPAEPEILSITPRSDHGLIAIIRDKQTRSAVRLSLDLDPAEGTITGLLVRPAPDHGDRAENWEAFDSRLGRLPGRVSAGAWELKDGDLRPVFEHAVGERLAVGSTFKLYVLGALAELIEAGEASWDEPLAIREDLKSLPSGDMQNLPAGEQRPLRHYAVKMISISDNTATDHLIHRVGRERIERYMAALHDEPARNRPFLTTQEMFKVKLSGDPDLPARFGAADEAARRAMLAPGGHVHKATARLALAGLWLAPIEIERVEWFATAHECARVMAELHRLSQRPGLEPLTEVLSTNPGIPIDGETWPRILFKGGSEPGVVNLTWLLEHHDGRVFILSLGWNNPVARVEEGLLIERAFDAVHLLAE